jgi:hypothetical protein
VPDTLATTAAVHIGRTSKSTSDAVERLSDADVIRQVTLGRRNGAFEAVGLFEAFTGFDSMPASSDTDTAISPWQQHRSRFPTSAISPPRHGPTLVW